LSKGRFRALPELATPAGEETLLFGQARGLPELAHKARLVRRSDGPIPKRSSPLLVSCSSII